MLGIPVKIPFAMTGKCVEFTSHLNVFHVAPGSGIAFSFSFTLFGWAIDVSELSLFVPNGKKFPYLRIYKHVPFNDL